MLKSRYIAIAIALSLPAAAVAGQSPYPASVDETAPISVSQPAARSVPQGGPPLAQNFPASPSEAPAFAFSDRARPGTPARLHGAYGSVFPSSINETGSRL